MSKKTALYDAHLAAGAKLIDFGGWQMPLQYKSGIIKEHKTVRSAVGMFDVSHMGEVTLKGPTAVADAHRLCSNDIESLAIGGAQYNLLCLPSGGIIDDCIVYKKSTSEIFIILNASNTKKDIQWITEHASKETQVVDISNETALIAVQGPSADKTVEAIATGTEKNSVSDMKSFQFENLEIAGVTCMVARTGYTGEDGFEIAMSASDALVVWNALAKAGCAPIGLGARDTLRLEAKLCLYGNDINETTSPIEANLGWAVKLSKIDFIGKDALVRQKQEGVKRKLIGFAVSGKGIPRNGYPVVSPSGEAIGRVTSGTKGITVGKAIGMAYIPSELAVVGQQILIDCRGKTVPADIKKGKFYKRG